MKKKSTGSFLNVLKEGFLPVFLVICLNFIFAYFIYQNQYELDPDQWTKTNITLSLLVFLFFFFLLYKSLTYKPKGQEKSSTDQPSLSIVVPVFNEGKIIYEVLQSITDQNYPLHKIELIVVNDGSTDDSLKEIQRFFDSYSGEKTLIDFVQNRGKKEALIEGFKTAKNEIVVTLDSDTYLNKESLAGLMTMMGNDIDAICGHTRVKNNQANILTKIQSYEYLISHQLFKSFESVYNGVLCCPGCFSAYRRDGLLEVLEDFKRSRVFNYKVDYGEDRYLTALFLNRQKKVLYSDFAEAYTMVPSRLGSFITQRKRWIKSWFVNTLYLFPLVRQKKPAFQFYFYLSFLFNLLITSSIPLFIYFVFKQNWNFLFHGLYIAFLYVIFTLIKQRKIKLWIPMVFYVFTLCVYAWLVPVAIASIKDERWGKRAA